MFWFEKCNPKSGIPDQIELYNSLFSRFLSTDSTGKLPVETGKIPVFRKIPVETGKIPANYR